MPRIHGAGTRGVAKEIDLEFRDAEKQAGLILPGISEGTLITEIYDLAKKDAWRIGINGSFGILTVRVHLQHRATTAAAK